MTAASRAGFWLRWMPAVFVLIWSTGFVVARFGMPNSPPMTFLSFRYALSLACLLPWIVLSRAPWPRTGLQTLHLMVTGALIQGVYLGGVWSAVRLGMGAGLSALIVGLQPVLTALWLSHSGDRVTWRQWGGLAMGLMGLFLVVSSKLAVASEVNAHTVGFCLCALAGITIGTLYQKRFVHTCDVRTAMTVQVAAALVMTLPLALLETEPVHWNSEMAGALAWSVCVLTLGGSSLLYLLIQRGAATQVTSLMYLVPPATALLAWLLFGEPITVLTVLGTGLTAWGVSWVVRQPSAQPKTE